MSLIDIIALIPLIIVTLVVLYLFAILPVGVKFRKGYPKPVGKYDFLILVPAHNEETGIVRTLASLKALEPTGKVEIVVIADNCTDRTAEIVLQQGVKVLERNDPVNRGKGFALEFGISQHNLDHYDAVVIVDADTIVAPNMLAVMARSLVNGFGAVQTSNEFLIENGTPLAYLQQMANCAENTFYYKARSVLGFPVLLRGTGMAIRSDVLKSHPWDSHSVTEDVDYAVNIILDGNDIDFAADTWVRSAATSTYEQSYSQKSRWAGGTFGLIFEKGLKVLTAGFTQGRPALIELAWSFLSLSRPSMIFICMIPLVLSPFASERFDLPFALWALVLIFLLISYLVMGILFVPDKASALKALFHAPFYGIWLLIVQFKALIGRGRGDWIRTERKD